MNPLARLLENRSPGERAVVFAIGTIAAIALLLTFVWIPLERTRSRLRAELPALRASMAALEREGDEAKRLRAMPPVSRSTSEPIGTSTKPLAGAQVTVIDPKTISVTSSDLAFGTLLEWLASTQSAQGLRVESARIEALGMPGRVRADLRLTRS